MQKIAGILLSIGAFVSIAGETRPVIFNIFGAIDNPQLQVEAIENDLTGWGVAHLLMGIGSLIAAFGVVLLTRQVQSLSNNRNVRIASYVSAAMAVVGALFWAIVSYNRVARAPQEVIANMGAANWMEWAYFLPTEIALILVGFVLLQTSYPKWLGWPVLVLGGLMLIASFSGGGVPLFHSILYLILGIALLLLRSRSPQPLPSAT
ncbi:MAG TPA: hypothetical protein VFR47_24835 [Anaerolineales bacterium]|nr:hypothetical protein [Anaerolineales bacterium]